ncbi:MAG: serine/threonine-protein kinase, partial [Chloroflexota bacterium]|nr:serine/threonine-protein kinase [Chloroflexota bacterium]
MEIKHIGRYEIIGELGSGGMATVLLGKDSFMDREVAIKLLPRLFMHDPTFKERFQREAKLLAQLEQSAIVPVYDFGYHEEQPYMVNRYMRGGSLLERITEQGAQPLDVSLAIVSRICSALSAAHKRGIVHRDLKPANILFDDSGQAFIADFGIAKLAQSTSTLTGNTLVGTPAYMSPEQFSGEYKVDGRSDQYSLAIVLFEMLSGELPFKGDTTAKLMKSHLMDDPPSLR